MSTQGSIDPLEVFCIGFGLLRYTPEKDADFSNGDVVRDHYEQLLKGFLYAVSPVNVDRVKMLVVHPKYVTTQITTECIQMNLPLVTYSKTWASRRLPEKL
jgi:hypothetical protein